MSNLVKVEFHGDTLEAIVDESGTPWVSLRPICDTFGLVLYIEGDRIIRNPALTARMVRTTPEFTGPESVPYCIRLDCLTAWLRSIDPDAIAANSQTRLTNYRHECAYAVLATLKGRTEQATGLDIAQAVDRSIATRLAPVIDRLAAIEAKLGLADVKKRTTNRRRK